MDNVRNYRSIEDFWDHFSKNQSGMIQQMSLPQRLIFKSAFYAGAMAYGHCIKQEGVTQESLVRESDKVMKETVSAFLEYLAKKEVET